MSKEEFFFRGMYLLPKDGALGAWFWQQETPESSEAKHWAPLYRYNPTSWFGVPTKMLSEFDIRKTRAAPVPILLKLSALPQRHDAKRVEMFPNYVRMWITGATPQYPLEKYLQIFSESPEAVRNLYPDVVPIHPQNPQDPVGTLWLGVTGTEHVDRARLDLEQGVVVANRDDTELYGKAAVACAEGLLLETAGRYGWEVGEYMVTKTFYGKAEEWPVRISRASISVSMYREESDDFRCVTSTPEIPKDDQVIQKIHALEVPRLCWKVNTLWDFYEDVHLIRGKVEQ